MNLKKIVSCMVLTLAILGLDITQSHANTEWNKQFEKLYDMLCTKVVLAPRNVTRKESFVKNWEIFDKSPKNFPQGKYEVKSEKVSIDLSDWDSHSSKNNWFQSYSCGSYYYWFRAHKCKIPSYDIKNMKREAIDELIKNEELILSFNSNREMHAKTQELCKNMNLFRYLSPYLRPIAMFVVTKNLMHKTYQALEKEGNNGDLINLLADCATIYFLYPEKHPLSSERVHNMDNFTTVILYDDVSQKHFNNYKKQIIESIKNFV